MDAVESLTISQPPDLARMVREKVSSGGYASASEVIHEGLLLLAEHEHDFDRWLQQELPRRLNELRTSPYMAVPLDDVFAAIRERHRTLVNRMKLQAR